MANDKSKPAEDSEEDFVAEPQLISHTRVKSEAGSEEVETGLVTNQPNLQDAGGQPLTFQDFLEYQKSQGQSPVATPKPHVIQRCWNCQKEQLGEFAGDHDVCSKCGFDRTKIFNLALLER